MKATQDNAVWVSNTYEQSNAETNWTLMDVSYRTPKSLLTPVSATTSALKVLNSSNPLNNGDSLSLYNATDGYVSSTVNITSQETASNTTSEGALTRLGTTVTSDFFVGFLNTWNPDGTRFWTYEGGGTFKEYVAPRPFDFVGASSEGSTLVNSYTLAFPTRGYTDSYYYLPNNQKLGCSFSSDGSYFFTVTSDTTGDMGRYVVTFTLSTPYDLSTVTNVKDTQVLYSGSKFYTLFTTKYGSTNASYFWNNGGFNNIKFSADGLKGFLIRRFWVQDVSQNGQMGSYGPLISFVCSTPYDLSTVTDMAYHNMIVNTSQTANGTHISDDGKVIHVFRTQGNSTAFIQRVHYADGFNASTYVSTYFANYMSINTANYYANNSYSYHGSITVDSTGYYKEVTSFDWVLQKLSVEPTPHWNRTNLDISTASLTAAPTKASIAGSTISGLSYQDNTRAAVTKEKLPFALTKASTPTDLYISPPMTYQNAGDFVTGDDILVNNVQVAAGTVTRVENYYSSTYGASILGGYTALPSTTVKSSALNATMRSQGVKTFHSATAHSYSSYNSPKGIAFNADGTRFWKAGPNATYTVNGVTVTNGKAIIEYAVSTPWDLGTTTEVKIFDGATLKATGHPSTNYESIDFSFSTDGTKFFILHGYSSGYIGYLNTLNLGSPWDLTSVTSSSFVNLNTLMGVSVQAQTSFSFSEDGTALAISYPSANADVTNPSICFTRVYILATPWDMTTASYAQITPAASYLASIVGEPNLGFFLYCIAAAQGSWDKGLYLKSNRGDFSSSFQQSTLTFSTTSVENFSFPTNYSGTPTKLLVADKGTKLYIYFGGLHQVYQINAPFGHFNDRYQVDISSLGLSEEPRDVRFGYKTTYESLGTPSVTAETDSYKELSYPSKPINAETLKFKIEGNTGAEVSRFNVDLYKSE